MSSTYASTTITSNTNTELTPIHWTAIGLAAITGVIHLSLYVTDDWLPFLFAGVGFLGAIALFVVLPRHRRPLYVAGMLFTASQIVGYLLFPMGPLWLGVLDKAVQIALIVVLGYLFVVETRHTSASRLSAEVTRRGPA
ncbi:hypothetical protein [Haloferax sp. DFSO52]|uniref:hypothetical protein n=1 Tax=Haloferax sp. DFSO52 TaxID=3388505 RepID=UPI003A89EAD8